MLKALKQILHKLFQKTEEEGILHNSFCKVNITLVPKLDKTSQENYRTVVLINIDTKFLTKY